VPGDPTSVLFLAPEPLHPNLTGPARRTVKLAEQVAERCAVTLAAPAPSDFPEGPFETLETGPHHDQQLAGAFAAHDVVVIQVLPSPRQLLSAVRAAPRLVVDMIAPLALEASETGPDGASRNALTHWRAREMTAHLAAADLVLCSNEKQRDLLMGAALASGLLTRGDSGQPLQERIAVVPHGLDPEQPRPTRAPLREAGVARPEDKVAVWGGGIWSWLDPITAIRALELLRPSRPDLKLAFVGFEHPDPSFRRVHAASTDAAISFARERELGDSVVFLPRWLDREEYLEHLMDADVGVSLHGQTLEARFASRTRVLDYVTAGLPVVCSRGDTMSELVAAHDLGRVVEPLDVDGCAAALDALTDGAGTRGRRPLPEALLWRNVARPLVEYCADPPPPARRASAAAALAVRGYPTFLRAVYAAGGARRVLGAAGRRAGAVLRHD
jgi:glycosyltransferase involved in cell wall biosynthesis